MCLLSICTIYEDSDTKGCGPKFPRSWHQPVCRGRQLASDWAGARSEVTSGGAGDPPWRTVNTNVPRDDITDRAESVSVFKIILSTAGTVDLNRIKQLELRGDMSPGNPVSPCLPLSPWLSGANHSSQFYCWTWSRQERGEKWVHWAGGHLIVVNWDIILVTASSSLTKYLTAV